MKKFTLKVEVEIVEREEGAVSTIRTCRFDARVSANSTREALRLFFDEPSKYLHFPNAMVTGLRVSDIFETKKKKLLQYEVEFDVTEKRRIVAASDEEARKMVEQDVKGVRIKNVSCVGER